MSNNIIDKIQISGQSYDVKDSSAATVVELTQQEYDDLPSSAKTGNTLFVITDAQAGDLTQYWTSAQTQSAINQATSGKASQSDLETVSGNVDTLSGTVTAHTADTTIHVTSSDKTTWSGKQDALISGTNIKTINNESLLGSGNITIQGGGGGKAISAGTNISVTTGETADTVSCTLPITGGTNGQIWHGEGNVRTFMYYAHAEGSGTYAYGRCSHAEGNATVSQGNYSHAEGITTSAMTNCSHAEGNGTKTSNMYEHASGQYNVSSSASTTFGDSGNTLFSVGNGTSTSARHNAFEIRQNGDMYLNNGTSDIKLQDYLQVKVVKLTQSAYDALSPNYDSNTLYVIVN